MRAKSLPQLKTCKGSIIAIQRTFSIIKPDATRRNLTGAINAKFEAAGLRIVAQKRIHLTAAQAGEFYKVQVGRDLYGELCEFKACEPVVAEMLESEEGMERGGEGRGARAPGIGAAGTSRAE